MTKIFTREEKVVLFVIKTLNELSDEGLIEGGHFKIIEEALPQLEGFKPTKEEVEATMNMLRSEGYVE